jgi:hypothetical protein
VDFIIVAGLVRASGHRTANCETLLVVMSDVARVRLRPLQQYFKHISIMYQLRRFRFGALGGLTFCRCFLAPTRRHESRTLISRVIMSPAVAGFVETAFRFR